jgi:hypothetical protein
MAPARQPFMSRRPPIAAIYNPCQGQVKNREIADFQGFVGQVPLFGWEGTDI